MEKFTDLEPIKKFTKRILKYYLLNPRISRTKGKIKD